MITAALLVIAIGVFIAFMVYVVRDVFRQLAFPPAGHRPTRLARPDVREMAITAGTAAPVWTALDEIQLTRLLHQAAVDSGQPIDSDKEEPDA